MFTLRQKAEIQWNGWGGGGVESHYREVVLLVKMKRKYQNEDSLRL